MNCVEGKFNLFKCKFCVKKKMNLFYFNFVKGNRGRAGNTFERRWHQQRGCTKTSR